MTDDEFFAASLTVAHMKGKIPHGPQLPESMPWSGDLFIREEEDGTDTVYTWRGKWSRDCPGLLRPVRD